MKPIFENFIGEFVVLVQSPLKSAHTIQHSSEVLDLLLHPDGCNIQVTREELLVTLNNNDNWEKR